MITAGLIGLGTLVLGLGVITAGVLAFLLRPAYRKPFLCPHADDPLCARFGCPDDPTWAGDGYD